MDLIQELILQHGQYSPHKGRIKNPTLSVKVNNPLCGDSLKMDIKINQKQITDISFFGEGCLISQASASLLIEEAKKTQDLERIKKFDKNTVLNLLGTPLTLSRIKCALLGLEALQEALINY